MSDQAGAVDAYIEALPPERQGHMRALRAAIRDSAPDAVEVITYRMPGFKLDGRFLVSYDAFKQHYSLFPATDAVIEELGDEIRPHLAGRGTIRFPAERPIPVELVRRIIAIRCREHARP